jgi:hypothetical protein
MPIRINLLAEAQAAEEMRRKDPVKRAVWVGGFLVFVVALASATLQFKIISERSEVKRLQMSWKQIEKDVQEVNEKRGSARLIEGKLSAIDQFTTNRMLWANVLNALQHTTVDNVQLVRIRSDQTFTLNEVKRTNSAAKPKAGTPPPPAPPATVTEKIMLTLEAKDYSSGDQFTKFNQALAGYPYFEAMLSKTNKIQLTSLSAPQLEGNRTFRGFGVQLFFEEKERTLHE